MSTFGPNAWLVDEMYERYLADPSSVGESWRDFFADYKGDGNGRDVSTEEPPAPKAEKKPEAEKEPEPEKKPKAEKKAEAEKKPEAEKAVKSERTAETGKEAKPKKEPAEARATAAG